MFLKMVLLEIKDLNIKAFIILNNSKTNIKISV